MRGPMVPKGRIGTGLFWLLVAAVFTLYEIHQAASLHSAVPAVVDQGIVDLRQRLSRAERALAEARTTNVRLQLEAEGGADRGSSIELVAVASSGSAGDKPASAAATLAGQAAAAAAGQSAAAPEPGITLPEPAGAAAAAGRGSTEGEGSGGSKPAQPNPNVPRLLGGIGASLFGGAAAGRGSKKAVKPGPGAVRAAQRSQTRREKLRLVFDHDRRGLAALLQRAGPALGDAVAARATTQRGIIVSAGTPHYLLQAYITISVVRHYHGCTLPITLAYWGHLGKETIDHNTRAFMQETLSGVDFMDMSSVPYPEHQRPLVDMADNSFFDGYKIKAYVLYVAPYAEVLVLDSDAIPLMDPAVMFDTDQYRSHGNLFFPDRGVPICTRPDLFEELGVPPPDDRNDGRLRQTEAGMFAFHRVMHADVLEWVLFLNSHEEVVYASLWGDKDTYSVAFSLAGKQAQFELSQPVSIAVSKSENELNWLGYIQHHPNGSALFHHRSLARYDVNVAPVRLDYILWQPTCEFLEQYNTGPFGEGVWGVNGCVPTFYDVKSDMERCGLPGLGLNEALALPVPADSYVSRVTAYTIEVAWAAARDAHATTSAFVDRSGLAEKKRQAAAEEVEDGSEYRLPPAKLWRDEAPVVSASAWQ